VQSAGQTSAVTWRERWAPSPDALAYRKAPARDQPASFCHSECTCAAAAGPPREDRGPWRRSASLDLERLWCDMLNL